jgi:hypothetical protein
MKSELISGAGIPDSALARKLSEFVRDRENDLLFYHSVRVYFWGVLAGRRKRLRFDPELLYAAALFHDIGLTPHYGNSQRRFEVDGANAAREFLSQEGISEAQIEIVWHAIAFHTTPGIPEFMQPEVALLQLGAGMDVAGRNFDQYPEAERHAVIVAFPREDDFEHRIIDAFYCGMKHRPDSTFGTFNDDVLAFKDPAFRRMDLCNIVLGSPWKA